MNSISTRRLSKLTTESEPSSYEALAGEYYDKVRHPTCNAFRAASRHIIVELLGSEKRRGVVVEVGAGKSIVPECVPSWQDIFEALFLIDSSPSMLAHSNPVAKDGATLLLENAQATSIKSFSTDLVISSLGDPYNTLELWLELRRMLTPGGIAIFTTPSPQWAAKFRPQRQMAPVDAAEFLSKDGGLLQVPSLILGEDEQRDMIRSAGLVPILTLVRSVDDIAEAASAPKLAVLESHEPFVIGYLASRP